MTWTLLAWLTEKATGEWGKHSCFWMVTYNIKRCKPSVNTGKGIHNNKTVIEEGNETWILYCDAMQNIKLSTTNWTEYHATNKRAKMVNGMFFWDIKNIY